MEDAICQFGERDVARYWQRNEHCGMNADQLERLKERERENERFRNAGPT